MAETVQYYLEQMVPELEDLENKGLFSNAEIKLIVKKRTNFEYALKRRIAKKIDFLRYIEYEMNLEELRKKRKVRIEATSGDLKQGVSDYAGQRRILFIFKRATNKFKGDVSLWMQYIDYVKGIRAENLLSGIFANALQFHPKKITLWIMAASWEFENNANIGSARVLMQRALRLNPESKTLWHEYFKLEMLYVEKIKARRRILGINEEEMTEEQKQVEQDMEMDQDDENMIMLPTITGEESDDENEEQKKSVKNAQNKTADALREGVNPILQGVLATIVYDSAIQAIPEDLEFRTKFIDIYRTFTNTKKGREHVLDTIRRDMGSRPDARAYLAARHLLAESAVSTDSPRYISYQDPAFVPAVQACIEEFNNAVKDIPTSEMYERYIDFLRSWQEKDIEENLKIYFAKMLERIFKTSIKQKTTSGRIYKAYTEHFLQTNREQAQKIIRQAVESYPKEPALWILRIQLKSEGDKTRSLFKQALSENPTSPDLWEAYCDWIEKECKDGNVSDLETDRLYTDACQEASALLPSLTSESVDRDRVKDFVLSSYVEWAYETNGIEAARAAYKKIIRNFYPTYAFYKTCLDIENKHPSENNQDIEYVYEMATRLDEHKEELYRLYVTHLRTHKKFKKADHVFWKASKEVPNFALETK